MDTISDFVSNHLKDDRGGHGFEHAQRVERTALFLAKQEGGDPRIIKAAALLHDCMDSKLGTETTERKKEIEDFLRSNGYSEKEKEAILDIIENISWHKGTQEATLEGKIVQDADRLEALGAIGLVRTIEYGSSKGRPFYEAKNLEDVDGEFVFKESTETTLSHFYDKLLRLENTMNTKTAKKMAHERTEFLRSFLAEFYSELSLKK